MRTSILHIIDEPISREDTNSTLQKWGYHVVSPQGMRTDDLKKETIGILKNDSAIYDILLLDLKYAGERLGGLKLCADLEAKGFRNRWRNIIIYSQLAQTGTEREQDTISQFLIDRGFNSNNFINHNEFDLKRKIKELL